MSRAEKRWWLVRLKCGETITNHLIYVKTIQEFKEILGEGIEVMYNGQATWQTMRHLTGCEIPNQTQIHNYANGPLTFVRDQIEAVLHPA